LGKPYILRLSHCWAWKRAREAEQDDRSRHNKDQIARLQAEFLGLDVDSPLSQMSAKQRRELADADIAYSRAKQMRRQLLQLDDVVELLESLFATMRDGIEAMPDRLERELSLRPEEVAIVQRVGSDVLTAMAERIEEAELRDQDVEAVEVQRQWTI
jgi:non-ribosomal peptide synthetase component E (peptide arylation enzyme)